MHGKMNDINYCTKQLPERDSERFLCRLSGGRPPGTLTEPAASRSVTSDAPDLEFSLDLFRCIAVVVRVSSKDLGLARLAALSALRILEVFAVVLVLFTD